MDAELTNGLETRKFNKRSNVVEYNRAAVLGLERLSENDRKFLLRNAAVLLENRDFHLAKNILARIIKDFPDDKLALKGLGKCFENCECLEDSWGQQANTICSALGDCGGAVNYIGVYTDDGYDWTLDGEEKEL